MKLVSEAFAELYPTLSRKRLNSISPEFNHIFSVFVNFSNESQRMQEIRQFSKIVVLAACGITGKNLFQISCKN